MILMIDNYDSFTYNIVQYCLELGVNLKIIRNDELTIDEIKKLNPIKIIISPGPSTPDEAGVSLELIEAYKDTQIPILGICLGHQAIAQAYGAKVIRANKLMHGKTSQILTSNHNNIFKDMPDEFRATRYHSLVVEQNSLPSIIKTIAKSSDDNEIMAIEIDGTKVYGLQFHPESIMSEYGHKMLDNFLKL